MVVINRPVKQNRILFICLSKHVVELSRKGCDTPVPNYEGASDTGL